jgi:Bacterial Ig-like domain
MTGSGIVVANILAGAASDLGGNPGEASTSTDNSVSFDNVAPTVTINQGGGQADPTDFSPIFFDVVFSESVTGFDGSDISLAGSTVGGTLVPFVTGSGPTYTVSVSGMTSSGAVVASIIAGAATDAGGNLSSASLAMVPQGHRMLAAPFANAELCNGNKANAPV